MFGARAIRPIPFPVSGEGDMDDKEKLDKAKSSLYAAEEILMEDTECDCPPEWPRCSNCRALHFIRKASRLIGEIEK